MVDTYQTIYIDTPDKNSISYVKGVIDNVSLALQEKGYNSVEPIAGYILSGDPSYITNYRNARNLISNLDRNEIVEELLKLYLQK